MSWSVFGGVIQAATWMPHEDSAGRVAGSCRWFLYIGYCIGGPFGLKLIERAPDRVVAAVLCQPVGHRPDNPDVMYNSGRDVWAPELRARRPDTDARDAGRHAGAPLSDVRGHCRVRAEGPGDGLPAEGAKDLLAKTIDQVRDFLRSHQPVTAGP